MSLTGKACPECAHRQDDGERCTRCGYEGVCDLTKARDVEYLRGIDRRARDKRIDRVRKVSVVFAMIVVGLLWFVPGFWSARRQYFAIPLLLDQLALVFVIALGITKLLEATAPPPKFGFLDEEPLR